MSESKNLYTTFDTSFPCIKKQPLEVLPFHWFKQKLQSQLLQRIHFQIFSILFGSSQLHFSKY